MKINAKFIKSSFAFECYRKKRGIMCKIKRIIAIATVHITFLFISGCGFGDAPALLVIDNKSGQKITDVTLSYSSSNNIISIGDIDAFSSYVHKVDCSKEDSLKIHYFTSNGIRKEDIAIGYIIKGMNEKIVFYIK